MSFFVPLHVSFWNFCLQFFFLWKSIVFCFHFWMYYLCWWIFFLSACSSSHIVFFLVLRSLSLTFNLNKYMNFWCIVRFSFSNRNDLFSLLILQLMPSMIQSSCSYYLVVFFFDFFALDCYAKDVRSFVAICLFFW